jgi:hypothetical protein
VNLRSLSECQVVARSAVRESKGAILMRNEGPAMGCCVGKKLRFNKVRFGSQKIALSGTIIVPHSADSGILTAFA